MHSTVKKYLKASDTLTPSLHKPTDDEEPKPNQQHPRISAPAPRPTTKPIKNVSAAYWEVFVTKTRKKSPNTSSPWKRKTRGCFIHDHTFHKFFNCKKLKDLCEQVSCRDSLKAATQKARNQPSASATPATISARRVKAQMKKDCDEVTAQKEQMAEQQRKMDKQMATP